MSNRFIRVFVCLLPVLSVQLGWGQATDGNALGTVQDSSRAAIPKARVKLENTATGVAYSVVAGPDGSYHFQNVPTGRYQLSAVANGFAATILENVSVELNKT